MLIGKYLDIETMKHLALRTQNGHRVTGINHWSFGCSGGVISRKKMFQPNRRKEHSLLGYRDTVLSDV